MVVYDSGFVNHVLIWLSYSSFIVSDMSWLFEFISK